MKVYNDIKMHDIKKLQLRGSIFVYNSTIKTGLLYTFSSYFCEMISNYRKKKEKKKTGDVSSFKSQNSRMD